MIESQMIMKFPEDYIFRSGSYTAGICKNCYSKWEIIQDGDIKQTKASFKEAMAVLNSYGYKAERVYK